MRKKKIKIVAFNPGLGNQLIVYLYCKYLQAHNNQVYTYFINKKQHNGSKEILNTFDVPMPRSPWWVSIILLGLRIAKKINPSSHCMCFDKNEYFEDAIYYYGYWQNINKYFGGDRNFYFSEAAKIAFRLPQTMTSQNLEILELTSNRTCVSLHVRRGDYLNFSDEYMKSATPEYYAKSISMIREKYGHPIILAFSDDPIWVRDNFDFQGLEYQIIDWNKSNNSYLDMYLMSQCSSSIIANSSFSYWGALLGKPKELVIYPKKWVVGSETDIFPSEWIGI